MPFNTKDITHGTAKIKTAFQENRPEIDKSMPDIGNSRLDIVESKPDIGDMRPDISNMKRYFANMRPDITDMKSNIDDMKYDITDIKPDIADRRLDIALSRFVFPVVKPFFANQNPGQSARGQYQHCCRFRHQPNFVIESEVTVFEQCGIVGIFY